MTSVAPSVNEMPTYYSTLTVGIYIICQLWVWTCLKSIVYFQEKATLNMLAKQIAHTCLFGTHAMLAIEFRNAHLPTPLILLRFTISPGSVPIIN